MTKKNSHVISEKPSARFKDAMRQIFSVPKAELERREGEYKAARKVERKQRRRHR